MAEAAIDDEKYGLYEAICAGCDIVAGVDDLGLCADCSDKLERYFIRKREWEYSALAFLLGPEDRKKLRDKIIREYGEKLELIV